MGASSLCVEQPPRRRSLGGWRGQEIVDTCALPGASAPPSAGGLRGVGRPLPSPQNGLEGCELEVSKARQYIRLQAAGIAVPSYKAVVGGKAALLAAAREAAYPLVLKPNCGGRGDGVALLESADALAAHIRALPLDALSPDGVTLLQQYIQSPQPRILRIELVGGRLLYAMNSSTADGFRLCAADECAAAPVGAPKPPKFTYRPDIHDDHPLVRQYAAFMRANGIDIAGFESIEDRDGRSYTYDVNVSTNYSTDVQREAGIDFYDKIADFFLLRMSKAFPNVFGQSCQTQAHL